MWCRVALFGETFSESFLTDIADCLSECVCVWDCKYTLFCDLLKTKSGTWGKFRSNNFNLHNQMCSLDLDPRCWTSFHPCALSRARIRVCSKLFFTIKHWSVWIFQLSWWQKKVHYMMTLHLIYYKQCNNQFRNPAFFSECKKIILSI